MAKRCDRSVYFTVSDEFTFIPELYCVEIKRHAKDLGISVVLRANCELMARREVLRLCPEFKHSLVLMEVYLARYAKIDWESGRSLVVKQEMPPHIPPCIDADSKLKRKKLPRIEEEGDAQ
jgi:hypothetical protein